jgi:hypothetical protein
MGCLRRRAVCAAHLTCPFLYCRIFVQLFRVRCLVRVAVVFLPYYAYILLYIPESELFYAQFKGVYLQRSLSILRCEGCHILLEPAPFVCSQKVECWSRRRESSGALLWRTRFTRLSIRFHPISAQTELSMSTVHIHIDILKSIQ